MSMIIGLTGPTGAGKSSASKAAEKFNIKVVDCDLLARKAVEKGTHGLKALENAFGRDILEIDGTLNRRSLAQKAFKNRESTELLNRTILPYIVELVKAEAGEQDMILDAPMLFESGINSICQKNIAVLADRKVRLERIIGRDNLTIKEAELRMNAGKDDDFYKQNADYIVYNNGGEQEFISKFNNIITNIFGGRNNV